MLSGVFVVLCVELLLLGGVLFGVGCDVVWIVQGGSEFVLGVYQWIGGVIGEIEVEVVQLVVVVVEIGYEEVYWFVGDVEVEYD